VPKKSLGDYKPYTHVYVDAMNLLVRSYHGMQTLSYNGIRTGMLYGVARLFNKYYHSKIVFLWEGKDSWRKKKYPSYKARRHHDRSDSSEFFGCVDRVKAILPLMGIDQEWVDTMEADDLVAHHCDLPGIVGKHVLLVSTDDDWYVCSRSNVDILDRNVIKTSAIVERELGFPGCRVIIYKILKGCSSDEVKGIPRFPTKLAKQLAGGCNTWDKLIPTMEAYGEHIWAERTRQNMWILERNADIVAPAGICDRDIESIKGSCDHERLYKALLGSGMESTVNKLKLENA